MAKKSALRGCPHWRSRSQYDRWAVRIVGGIAWCGECSVIVGATSRRKFLSLIRRTMREGREYYEVARDLGMTFEKFRHAVTALGYTIVERPCLVKHSELTDGERERAWR